MESGSELPSPELIKKNMYLFTWKAECQRERRRVRILLSADSFPHMEVTARSGPDLSQEARDSNLAYHMVGKSPRPWGIFYC